MDLADLTITSEAAASGIRVAVLMVAVTMTMTCVKFAHRAFRHAERRAWALLAYATIIGVPALMLMGQFQTSLPVLATGLYATALGLGVLALRTSYVVRWCRAV